MSAQAEKVLRRDLRRAVGAEAIGVIDHNAKALAALQKQIGLQYAPEIDEWLSSSDRYLLRITSRNYEDLEALIEGQGARIGNLMAAHTGFTGRTFWQRLRWLVTGR